VRTRRRWRNEA